MAKCDTTTKRILGLLLLIAIIATQPGFTQKAASKNQRGNALFAEGKFEEAEKAYLEAQAELPDRPELFYNLGNTLIKRNKLDQALQSLRQAESKGDEILRGDSWFNIGNALFEKGDYPAAAQSYIQSLGIDPSDKEAKHNLELALNKIDEQQQMGQDKNQQSDRENPEESQDQQQGPGDSSDSPEENQQSPQSREDQEQNEPANPQSSQPEHQEGSLTKEQALQILDALQNQELAEQRKLLQRRARRKARGWDW